ncbi:sporulation inhibitor of replication protein SirA [Shouchella lonarensis]|uniref:Sporulation inhibitor of replication protein SirA n=1 Tax=Shouchella lonarensis TaxID=1464122 RepID=A0A1G6HEH1_9BACI|nr:sporulation inhibitor of replication protein SirA [Shouchella lonarensis]SDB92659.1 Protein of unknown function [Shouchella lonarensis]
MRHYELYLLDQAVAASYLGQEATLFQLFEEFSHASANERVQLEKQIHYITRPIPKLALDETISRYCYEIDEGVYTTYVQRGRAHRCQLKIKERVVFVSAEGDTYTETVMFDLLKSVDGLFFAVNVREGRFGWLQPLAKERVY